jgi:hypothetical protein
MKEDVIYSRFRLPEIKNTKNVSPKISKDSCGVMINNQKILDLEDEQFYLFKSFMKPKIISDEKDTKWASILLEVDIPKFNKYLSSEEMIRNRRNFYSVIEKCYQEKMNSYIDHMIINLFRNTIMASNFGSIPWMVRKEFCQFKNYYQNESNVMKIGDVSLDIKNGLTHTKSKMNKVKLSGGILLDKTDCNWMEEMNKLILIRNKYDDVWTDEKCESLDNSPNTTPLKINATLVVCSQLMIQSWKNSLESEKVVIITSKRTHKSLTYIDIAKSDVVIISHEYMSSKSYSSLWEDYKLNDYVSVNDVFKIMFTEYSKCKSLHRFTSPVLSIVKWKRVIIDSGSINIYLKDNTFKELIQTIISDYKWLQLTEFPFMRDDIIDIVNIIAGKNINYPIYNEDGTVHYLDNLIRKIEKTRNCNQIKTQIIKVNANNYESQLHKYVMESVMTTDEVDDILFNFKSKNAVRCHDINLESKLDDCSICLENGNTKSVLKCGHVYCYSCILENMKYNKKCPLCRVAIDYKSIYTLSRVSTMVSRIARLNELLKKSKKRDEKVIIYVKNHKTGTYLSKYLDKKNMNYIYCSGKIERKNKMITDANNSTGFKSIVLQMDDASISKSIKGIQKIYFVNDIDTKIINDNYCGYDCLNGSNIDITLFYLKQKFKN